MLGVSQEERSGAVSIVSGSETGIAKRTTFRSRQRLQWRPISAENGKEPTKKWVIRTFYSNSSADNKCPKVSASHQQNTSSNNPSFLAPPVSTELTPLANQSKSSARWVAPKTLQRDESNRCGMSTEPEDMSSSKVSTLANGHRPSVDPPSMSYREPFVQKNQSSGCWKKSDNQNNQPAVAPRKISVYRGEPAIYFDESLINASAEKFKYCLVGKFAHSWPSLAQIRVWASREWKLKGKWSITILDLNCVFIRLDNEIDMIRIWIRNAWWIKGHLMRVFKWTPEFHLEKGEPSSAGVWITLPFLPLVFFQEDVLFSIASLLGKPLAIDDQIRTLSRTNVARVCIEVDLLVQMPRQVWIGIAGQGFWQPIRYGKLPSYCINCSQQGHSTTVCKFKTSKPETDHPIKKGSCTVVEPSTGFGVASETLTEYKANHHPNNPGSECVSIKNHTKPQVEVCHSNECRSDMNSSVESRPQNSREHSSVVQVIRSNSVDLKFSSNWLGGGCPHEEYNSFKASNKKFVEDENCQTKQIQNCHPVQDEKKNNQLIIAAPSQQQSVRFKDAGSIPKILTRTEEIEILNVAANCPSNKENCKIVKPEEGNKSVSQNLVHEEPFCRPHFAEIQQTDAKVLQRTHREIDNPDKSRGEVDSLVKPPISQIPKGQQSTEMIGASSVDARSSKNLARDWHSQDWFLKSNSFVQNYVEGESSRAKNSRKHYAIRNKGSSSQPIIMTSPQLSPKRVTLVEALDKSLGNMERIKMGSNNEKDYYMEPSAPKHHTIQGKGSGSQPIIKTSPELSPKRVTLVEAMDRKLANRGNIKMGSNKGKQDFGATFSTFLIMNETFICTTEENDHMKPSGKQAADKMNKTDLLGTGKAVLDKIFKIQMQE